MFLLSPGYWPDTYFVKSYWDDDYWPVYGSLRPSTGYYVDKFLQREDEEILELITVIVSSGILDNE